MADPRATGGLAFLLIATALFAAGGVWLLSHTLLRDVDHPEYSTLSDAPKGASVLYETLSHMPLDVRRLYETGSLPDGATLFRIGQPLSRWQLRDIPSSTEETAFLTDGGRLVYAFERGFFYNAGSDSSCSETGTCACASATNRPPISSSSLTQGISLTVFSNQTEHAEADLPDARLPWYSSVVFTLSDKAAERWRTLYELDGHPVLIETRFGKGSIVLATDCYFLSNEGLAKDCRPALLAALVGTSRTVLFDETIHGISETRNTAWLMHRYRLHGLIAALALSMLLAFWRHVCPLLPRARETAASTSLQGFRQEDGLESLLHGHLPVAHLPRHLYEAWRQSVASPDEAACREMEHLLDTAEAARKPPVETCRALHALTRRKPRSIAVIHHPLATNH